jgi:hypothetical protein
MEICRAYLHYVTIVKTALGLALNIHASLDCPSLLANVATCRADELTDILHQRV